MGTKGKEIPAKDEKLDNSSKEAKMIHSLYRSGDILRVMRWLFFVLLVHTLMR